MIWCNAKGPTLLLWYFWQKCITTIQLWESIKQTQIEEHFKKCLAMHFKSIKVMKDKETLRNCPWLEEIKETQRVNAVWDPGLDPEPENKN